MSEAPSPSPPDADAPSNEAAAAAAATSPEAFAAMPEADRPPHLQRLNPQQFDAVTHVDGPLLILAGAGSGKTRVLTRRIAHLLHLGVEPDRIFAVTFTNKAASEMKERVAELVGGAGRKVWVSTFHSSCCRILRMEAEALGYTNRFAIYDDDDQHRIVKQIVADLGYDKKVVVPKAILGRIDHFKNRMMTVETLVRQRRAAGHDPLVRVWRAYEEALTASDAMDFNDLIGKAVQLFEEHPDVLEKYREQFRYILVDEYQDTNRSQYRMLRLLAGGHHNLAVVGDDDQSIYGFRGADISNILNFEADFPEAKTIRMEQNYRCTANILALANAVVAKNTERIDKKLWTETDGGAKVSFLVADDPQEEARRIARAVHGLRRRGVGYDDVAIIYRTNAASQPLEAAMREMRIPHKVVGGRQFYSRREIRDALGFLRLLVNPADDSAFLRVVNVPTRGIGPKTITKIREEAATHGEPLLKVARSMGRGSDRAGKAIGGFVRLVDDLLERAQTSSLPALVQYVLEASGYWAMLEGEDSHEARGRMDNLKALLRDAAGFDPLEHLADTPDAMTPEVAAPTGAFGADGEVVHWDDEDDDALQPLPMETLSLWLDRISLTGQDEEIPEEGEVTLMTVHNSKGLEYPVVFVAQMVEGQFPHSRSAEEPDGVSEERRLAYVAFTRAQTRLVITRSRKELVWDRTAGGRGRTKKPVAPSRFLFGIPLQVCEGELPRDDDAGEGDDGVRIVRDPDPDHDPVAQAQARLQQLIAQRRSRARVRPSHVLQRVGSPPDDEHGADAPSDEPPPDLPDSYTEVQIESRDDLRPGVLVVHDRYGIGEVVRATSATVRVRFQGRVRPLGLSDPRLRLLRD